MLEPFVVSSSDNYAGEVYLAQAYSQLAQLTDDATAKYIEKAISIYQQVDKESYSLQVKIDYFALLVQFADTQRRNGDIETAISCYCYYLILQWKQGKRRYAIIGNACLK